MKKIHVNLLFISIIILILLVMFLQYKQISSVKYPDYSSFYGLRQVEHIKDSFSPIVFDPLSYQGRTSVMQIAFYYLVSLFTLVIPSMLFFKFASIVFWFLIVLLIYLISNKLFANKLIVMLITFFTILSPILFTTNLNTFNSTLLFTLLFLLVLNSFFILRNENAYLFVILIFLSSLVSSLSLIFVLGFAIYMVLMKLNSKKLMKSETEIIIFSSVFIAWIHFIIYRDLFLDYGFSLFKSTMPTEIFLGSFYDLSIPLAISIAGLIPLILGIYGTYFVLFKHPTKKNLLIVSFLLSFIVALWFGLMSFAQGFLFITILLIFLSGVTLKQLNGYLNKTVLQNLKPLFVVGILALIILNFLPVFNYSRVIQENSPSEDDLMTMHFIADNVPMDSTILATIEEGHLISYAANRKNFFDTNYVFAPFANQRYLDAKTMFLSKSQSTILNQMDYYGINYVYISSQTKKTYAYTSNPFENSDCFKLVFSTNTTKLYEEICN